MFDLLQRGRVNTLMNIDFLQLLEINSLIYVLFFIFFSFQPSHNRRGATYFSKKARHSEVLWNNLAWAIGIICPQNLNFFWLNLGDKSTQFFGLNLGDKSTQCRRAQEKMRY